MIVELVSLYFVIGLVTLLILIGLSRVDTESTEHLKESLGQVILLSLLAWPYVVFIWIFSFEFWLKPIKLFK